ncbi:MAG: RyR domain-containing protein, partial [Chryseobacterium sp.]
MNYQPNPIDTSQIKIDKEELQLAECLAMNTHEIWAKQKIKDGWKYGPNKDDRLKLHPYLISYEQLPDEEKEHDYLTAIEAIKVLLASGYKIEKNNNRIKDISSEEQDKNITEILDNLKNSNQMSISSLLKIQRENIHIKFYSSSLYINLAEEILQLGEPLISYDILTEGLKYWPDDLELKNLMALALARIGAPKRAIEILNSLINNQGKNNEDIWNRLGGSK